MTFTRRYTKRHGKVAVWTERRAEEKGKHRLVWPESGQDEELNTKLLGELRLRVLRKMIDGNTGKWPRKNTNNNNGKVDHTSEWITISPPGEAAGERRVYQII